MRILFSGSLNLQQEDSVMKGYEERVCRHALNRIFGNNPRTAHSILGHFGSAAKVFASGKGLLREAVPYTKNAGKISDEEYEKSEKELARLEAQGYGFVTNDSPSFPPLLKECPDHPLGLYVRSCSKENLFGRRPHIAIIGTRDCSPYGRTECRNIIRALASVPERPVIVSGMAVGIDIAAHRAALDFGLPTTGVLPVGIEDVYPKSHYGEASRIAETPGCSLVTDFPPGTPVSKYNFLRRNRIIAGMCSAALLIESKVKGGGMMTARLALSYSRDVFALPGRIDEPRSGGCNLLIYEGAAAPVISAFSLCAALGFTTVSLPQERRMDEPAIAETYRGRTSPEDTALLSRMLSAIRHRSGISIDELAEECGTGSVHAAQLVGLLESDGLIRTDLMRRCTIRI